MMIEFLMGEIKKTRIGIFLLCACAVISVTYFSMRLYTEIADDNRYVITDISIFYNAGKRFLDTGQLYERYENYQENYCPSSGNYKFPPAYQLTVIPHLLLGLSDIGYFRATRVEYLVIFLIASWLLMRTIEQIFCVDGRDNIIYFRLLFIIVSVCSSGLLDNLVAIHPEILIYAMVCLAFVFAKRRSFTSGSLIAAATCLKIYPVFLMIWFILGRNVRAKYGFLVTFVIINIVALLVFGIGEHIFFATHIFPLLASEKASMISHNMSIEAYLAFHHVIANDQGHVSPLFFKILALSVAVLLGCIVDGQNEKQLWVYYGAIVSGILVFLPNYWLQHQIFLGLPVLCLLAYGMHARSMPLKILLVFVTIVLAVDKQMAAAIINSHMQGIPPGDISEYRNMHPGADLLLHFAPLGWSVIQLIDLKPLVPSVILAASSWVLIRQHWLDRPVFKS